MTVWFFWSQARHNLAEAKANMTASFLAGVCFGFDEVAFRVIRFPNTCSFTFGVFPGVVEFPVWVVALPCADRNVLVERPCLEGVAIFTPPFPGAMAGIVHHLASGAELAIFQIIFPGAYAFAVFIAAGDGERPIAEIFF